MTIPDGNDNDTMNFSQEDDSEVTTPPTGNDYRYRNSVPDITEQPPAPSDPNGGSGRATLIALGIILVIGALVAAFFLLDLGGDSEEPDATAEVEIPEPAPAVVLTPLWDTIATLEADESVDPAEVEEIRQQLEDIDANTVSNEQLTTILNDLETNFEGRFIDTDELSAEIDNLLQSEGFESSVIDIVAAANAQATQTQEAVECLVEALPEYTSVRVYAQPADGAERVDFIRPGRQYRVVSRTNGAWNTVTLWFQIDLDPTNNIRPWVRSDLVNESDQDKCMAIAVR